MKKNGLQDLKLLFRQEQFLPIPVQLAGREVEFKIELKSGDFVTIQMLVSEIETVTNFLDNLRIKAGDE